MSFYQLLASLAACGTKEELRRWAVDTIEPRRALSRFQQDELRERTIEKQLEIWRLQRAA